MQRLGNNCVMERRAPRGARELKPGVQDSCTSSNPVVLREGHVN